jgi:cystathionine beta-lyase/cystathionine gamma-synthase
VHGGGARDEGAATPLFCAPWAARRAAAAKIALLEDAEEALLFGSGMAAIAATLLALLPPGGRLVAARELYGDAHILVTRELRRLGFQTALVDMNDAHAWRRELDRGADVLYVEAVSNPTLRVADLPLLGRLARELGACAVVDSTFATPVNLRPGEHGFAVVVHSATKYLSGHADVGAGAVAGPAALLERVRAHGELLGARLDPHAAFLLERGLKTLPLRMERHNASGLAVADWLARHPDVERATHPFLPSHPDHDRARRLLRGGSGIVTFRVHGGRRRVERLLSALRLIRRAPTVGCVESVVCVPVASSHRALAGAELSALGLTAADVRLSVGLEEVDDLVCDLEAAFRSSRAAPPRAHEDAEGRQPDPGEQQRDDQPIVGREPAGVAGTVASAADRREREQEQ